MIAIVPYELRKENSRIHEEMDEMRKKLSYIEKLLDRKAVKPSDSGK